GAPVWRLVSAKSGCRGAGVWGGESTEVLNWSPGWVGVLKGAFRTPAVSRKARSGHSTSRTRRSGHRRCPERAFHDRTPRTERRDPRRAEVAGTGTPPSLGGGRVVGFDSIGRFRRNSSSAAGVDNCHPVGASERDTRAGGLPQQGVDWGPEAGQRLVVLDG